MPAADSTFTFSPFAIRRVEYASFICLSLASRMF